MRDGDDTVKVESIVTEFLSAQSLKVLPQGPFGDAVNQFVSKDDKHAMELFVSEHLSGQVQQMLGLESDDEDLNTAMEIYRARIEQQTASGLSAKRIQPEERKRVLRPKPDTWDSDFDGRWEEEPDAWIYEEVGQSMAPTTQGASGSASRQARGKARQRAVEDDEDEDMVEETEPPPVKTTGRGGARATASRAKPAPKKAAPAKKAPVRGRARKAATPSDEEEEEEDVVMDSEEEEAPPPPPKAKAKTTRQPAKRAAAAKQTTLDFSQSQRTTRRGGAGTQKKAVEISDDEISEDDAFEPAPVASRTRKR